MEIGEFILASGSPRRRQLLEEAGYRFRVVPSPLPEPDEAHAPLSPAQQAEALAYFKARCVVEALRPSVPVLAADTVVALDGRLFGKPADAEEARRMLATLSGTRHVVITGVALIGPMGDRLIASDSTHVQMRRLSDEEITQYVASGDWGGKAGGYGIQDSGDAFIDHIEGSFTNVIGLPMELVKDLLGQLTMRERYRGREAGS